MLLLDQVSNFLKSILYIFVFCRTYLLNQIFNILRPLFDVIFVLSKTIIVILLISFILIIGLYFFIRSVSQLVSFLGIYHPISIDGESYGETKINKIWKVFQIYLILSFPMFFTIFITLYTIKISPGALIPMSILLTPTLMVLTRILSNPSETFFSKYCIQLSNPPSGVKYDTAYKNYKERIISFFFSFICATIMISLFQIYTEAIYSSTTDTLSNTLKQQFSQEILFSQNMVVLFIGYIIALFILTGYSELYLARVAYPAFQDYNP